MTNISIKAVEYPREKVLELSNLTDLGLQELLQAEAFKWEIEDEIDKRDGR